MLIHLININDENWLEMMRKVIPYLEILFFTTVEMSNNNNDNNYITRKNYLNQKAHVVTKCDPGTTATWMTHFSGCPKTNKATEFMRH